MSRSSILAHAARFTPEERTHAWVSALGFAPASDADLIWGLRRLWGNLGPRELGEITGISHQTVSQISGGHSNMGPKTAMKLVKAMERRKVDPLELAHTMERQPAFQGWQVPPGGAAPLPPEPVIEAVRQYRKQRPQQVYGQAEQVGEPEYARPVPRNPERLRILALVEDWPEEDLDTLYRRVLGLNGGHGG